VVFAVENIPGEYGQALLANIRGGGEFGPKWHQAGLKENRQRVYDDLHAVAESLIEKKNTSAKNLGIFGGKLGHRVETGAGKTTPMLR
jgi:prolyl oligopeptidase